MIRNEPSITLLSGSTSTSSLFSFKSRETIRAEVVGNDASGKLLLKIAGHTIAARGMKHLQTGDVFQAKVVITDSTIFLKPISYFFDTSPSLLTQLGLLNTPDHVFLVNFLQNLQVRLVPEKIKNLIRISSKFLGKEKEAATAAAILEERGIEPSEPNILIFISALEGRLLQKNRDFLAYINRKKGSDRHWVVLPFEKRIANIECRGSVRFLLELSSSKTIETHITILHDGQRWDFSIKDDTCLCNTVPSFNPVVTSKFVVYLKEILADFNIIDVIFQSLDVKYMSEGVDLQV